MWCTVHIFFILILFYIIHQHLMAAGGGILHIFSPRFECTRSVTTRGVERMSWRRYVFLHRIHPHSILIGFTLNRKREGTEVRGRMNHEEVEKTCCSGFPSLPPQLCRLIIVALTITTHQHTVFSQPLEALCGAVTCLYSALLDNGAADIPSVLDKAAS